MCPQTEYALLNKAHKSLPSWTYHGAQIFPFTLLYPVYNSIPSFFLFQLFLLVTLVQCNFGD